MTGGSWPRGYVAIDETYSHPAEAPPVLAWVAAHMPDVDLQPFQRAYLCRMITTSYGVPPALLGLSPQGRPLRGRYRLDLGEYHRRQLARRRRRRRGRR